MIHFQCRCGTTLSADEAAAGDEVRCASCGAELVVPALNSTPKLRPNGRRDTGTHDFDAEIVAAARTAPARPKKTPRRVPAVEAPTSPEPAADPAPGYDLIRLQVWDHRLGFLSWLILIVFGAASGATLAVLPAGATVRVATAAGILVLAVLGFVSLRVLQEVCRSVMGLAARQREMAGDLLKSGRSH